jgi:uncharacterized protein (TIGR02246 family)
MVFWLASSYNRSVAIKTELIEEAIREANQNFERTFFSGNAEAMAGLYTEEAQLLPTGSEPISGRGAIAQFWGQLMKTGIKKAKLESLEIDPQGATVIEIGRYTLFGDGETQLDRGKYIVIWKLIKGEWKLHRDIWNTSVAPKS